VIVKGILLANERHDESSFWWVRFRLEEEECAHEQSVESDSTPVPVVKVTQFKNFGNIRGRTNGRGKSQILDFLTVFG
jgi:hypothetical protein